MRPLDEVYAAAVAAAAQVSGASRVRGSSMYSMYEQSINHDVQGVGADIRMAQINSQNEGCDKGRGGEQGAECECYNNYKVQCVLCSVGCVGGWA